MIAVKASLAVFIAGIAVLSCAEAACDTFQASSCVATNVFGSNIFGSDADRCDDWNACATQHDCTTEELESATIYGDPCNADCDSFSFTTCVNEANLANLFSGSATCSDWNECLSDNSCTNEVVSTSMNNPCSAAEFRAWILMSGLMAIVAYLLA